MSSTATKPLVDYLRSDSQLRTLAPGDVWEKTAHQGSATPFVIVEFVIGIDRRCGGGSKVTEFTYQVTAVGPAAQIALVRDAAARLDVLLDNGPLVIAGLTGFHVLRAQRVEPIEEPYPEITMGVRREQLGGRYEIEAEARAA